MMKINAALLKRETKESGDVDAMIVMYEDIVCHNQAWVFELDFMVN